MNPKTVGKILRGGGYPIELEQISHSGDLHLWQNTDLILMTPEEAAQLVSLLRLAVGDNDQCESAPEPLRRFPALYERVQVHDGKTDETWSGHRYVIEVGTGTTRDDGRAYVRLDGDWGDSDAVFSWDEGARGFRFRRNDTLYLIPMNVSEET